METPKEVTDKILKLTILVQENCPQLTDRLDKVRDSLPSSGSVQDLERYCRAMEDMLKGQLPEHPEL